MLAFVEKQRLHIRFVTNTHSHHDHTQGNDRILYKTGAEFIDCRRLAHGGHIPVGQNNLMVYKTPGHTNDCVTFQAGNALITGDTLFNGTVGNCFSGNLRSFFNSIRFLMTFDPATLIYSGHDYVQESMAFARSLERHNPEIDRYMEKYNRSHVVSTLADELKVNPYLRFNDPWMIRIMQSRGVPITTEYERWCSLMGLF
jgi:hydroxyacylglutathione hydrolase